VEVLYPVQNPELRNAIVEKILPVQLQDNLKLRLLKSDGTYERRTVADGVKPLNAQAWFLKHCGCWYHGVL
jgi:polyphosphate kinase